MKNEQCKVLKVQHQFPEVNMQCINFYDNIIPHSPGHSKLNLRKVTQPQRIALSLPHQQFHYKLQSFQFCSFTR